jgi:hypothetical protein
MYCWPVIVFVILYVLALLVSLLLVPTFHEGLIATSGALLLYLLIGLIIIFIVWWLCHIGQVAWAWLVMIIAIVILFLIGIFNGMTRRPYQPAIQAPITLMPIYQG